MELGLDDKVVCITGGSRGIGLATAVAFAREGASVVICARDHTKLDNAKLYVSKETMHDIDAIRADVTVREDIDRLATYVEQKYGRLDVLVNNAGVGVYKGFESVTESDLVHGMALNFFAPFLVTQRFLPMLATAKTASVINVSGRTGLRGTFPPGSSCTGPAKAAEIRLSIDLATELAQFGVRVNCVVPGVVEVEERFRNWERTVLSPDASDDELRRLRETVDGRVKRPDGGRPWGQPQNIADVIVFLASGRAEYVNGVALTVDGGPHVRSYLTELLETKENVRSV